MSLPSPLPGQFCWDSAPFQYSGCFTRMRLDAQTYGKRQLFQSSYVTQAAGVTHDREQGEGKQIHSESLVNKRNPSWSSALLHSTTPCQHGSRSDEVLKKKSREVASFQLEPGK